MILIDDDGVDVDNAGNAEVDDLMPLIHTIDLILTALAV